MRRNFNISKLVSVLVGYLYWGVRVDLSSLSRLFSVNFLSLIFVILLCLLFLLFAYFADIFISSMWTDLRVAVPQGDDVLFSLAESLPDVALADRAPSTSSKFSSTYNR